jgi:hypothetical protein
LKSKELHTSQTTISVSAGEMLKYMLTLVDAKVRAGGSIYSPKQINKETLLEGLS